MNTPDGKTSSIQSAVPTSHNHKRQRSKGNDWEILGGLKEGQRFDGTPIRFESFLLKRRKWPLKGWHKRYFSLDKGILIYAKTPLDMSKGKTHGRIDMGMSVVSTKANSRRIDIDAEEYIYHIKVKNKDLYSQWVVHLKEHRLFRQNDICYRKKDASESLSTPISTVDTAFQSGNATHDAISRASSNYDDIKKDLNDLDVKMVLLSSYLQCVEFNSGEKNKIHDVETGTSDPSKKNRRRFLLRRGEKKNSSNNNLKAAAKKSNENKPNTFNLDLPFHNESSDIGDCCGIKLCLSNLSLNDTEVGISHTSTSATHSDGLKIPIKSTMTRSYTEIYKNDDLASQLSSITLAATKNQPSTVDTAQDFLALANDVHLQLRQCLKRIKCEIRMNLPTDDIHSNEVELVTLNSLQPFLKNLFEQKNQLDEKLNRMHDKSNLNHSSMEFTPASPTSKTKVLQRGGSLDEDGSTILHRPLVGAKSNESCSVLSISEYYDATERFSDCSSSSEDDDDRSVITDLSEDDAGEYAASIKPVLSQSSMNRRSKLPCPKPPDTISLWSLLCKNIGKDLSKISMPVTLNEPLNTLQRLCEELEYCELLDKAAVIEDPVERMLYVAAFAVSAYSGSAYRGGFKPFNPLLGETYECVREDKSFRFIAEQVSHHPPISACHAESDNFAFWQDMRIKSKFWGKSMEIIPFGTVHVELKKSNTHYRWNKVTTCVHNIFNGQRWVDQYGEMTITDGELKCKLTFSKASYWSSKRREVFGAITNQAGELLMPIFGKWTEALYCGSPPTRCIWRPGAMPDDHELYYGFTRFAIELNELTPELTKILPPTDTRFRLDQRLLEEGQINLAEAVKIKLEQLQRDRWREREEKGEKYFPRWFFKKQNVVSEDQWAFNNEYWPARVSGFSSIEFEDLWPSELLGKELEINRNPT